jgi:hypothetical protein
MSASFSRKVEVILDAESAALLKPPGPSFPLDGVKHRFHQHLKPMITAELTTHPSHLRLLFMARIVSGVFRLLRI